MERSEVRKILQRSTCDRFPSTSLREGKGVLRSKKIRFQFTSRFPLRNIEACIR
ncbi:hypothetical protein COCNU_05G010570 [Cocos nucifera]|uniref:Uncharacterized protein n=1 Tax=Cocos nucifera TaxID=13894 RepID=A0A8K0I9I6_COCNU|nr:hypothetical protein COCNU_05G010570 [Cocos nucifera]